MDFESFTPKCIIIWAEIFVAFFFIVIYESCYQLNFDKSKVLVGEEVRWTSLASGTQESVYSSIVKIVFLKQLKLFGIFIAL